MAAPSGLFEFVRLKPSQDTAVGAVIHQHTEDSWKRLAFFSKRLQPPKPRYSTFCSELLAVYLVVRYFRHALESRLLKVLIDPKPVVIALHSASDRYLTREIPHFIVGI